MDRLTGPPSATFETDRLQRRIYSVSELNRELKALIEDKYAYIWIKGEITNVRTPGSGHAYFTLKDEQAQLAAVMFRAQVRLLRFDLQDGLQVTGFGRLGLYEQRGTYQAIFEFLEPSGLGALQAAFEQLKARLAAEGWFDAQHKRAIPFLPKKIGIITSPDGAVLHDILHVVGRRFPRMSLQLLPVTVQGSGCEEQIAAALALANRRRDLDVLIVARGGGSLEDMRAFNSEIVARAIFDSEIPVISAVGHETDYTIADFVADLRAPTPSAAAELVVPIQAELERQLHLCRNRLITAMQQRLRLSQNLLTLATTRLRHPLRRLQDLQLRLDDLRQRLMRTMESKINLQRQAMGWLARRLSRETPQQKCIKYRLLIDQYKSKTLKNMSLMLSMHHARLDRATARLEALSPLQVLQRGYAIVRTLPRQRVVRDSSQVTVGQRLELLLARGQLQAQVVQPPLNQAPLPLMQKDRLNGETEL